MPMSELMSWVAYYKELDRRERAGKGDLMAMSEDEIVGAFGA